MKDVLAATRDRLNRIVSVAQRAIDDGELQYDEILNSLMAQVSVLADTLSLRAASPVIGEEPIVAISHRVFQSIERHTGVGYAQITRRTKPRRIVVPRQVAMWALRKFTSMPLRDIAVASGRKDHSTVIYACSRVDYERRQAADGRTGLQRAVLSNLVEADIREASNGAAA